MQHAVYNAIINIKESDLVTGPKRKYEIHSRSFSPHNSLSECLRLPRQGLSSRCRRCTEKNSREERTRWENIMQVLLILCTYTTHRMKRWRWLVRNLILGFRFCARVTQIAVISSLGCTKLYNGNAETRMNDLILFYFKRLPFSPSLGPSASSGPPGVPFPLSETGNVPYFTRHLEMSTSLTVNKSNPTHLLCVCVFLCVCGAAHIK